MTSLTPRITLVGGPTVVLRYGGLTLLTDPTFDEPQAYGHLAKTRGPALGPADVGRVDAVLLSHDQHADNLDHSGRAFLATVPVTLSTRAAAGRMPGVVGMAPGAAARVGDVDVVAVAAQHGPAAVVPLVGDVIGFVLRSEGWPTVYVTGDNASVRVAARVLARHPDVAIIVLHAGAAAVERLGRVLLTLDAARAAKVAALAPDATIVPVHIDDWAHFSQPRDAFLDAFRASAGAHQLLVLEPGVEAEIAPREARPEPIGGARRG